VSGRLMSIVAIILVLILGLLLLAWVDGGREEDRLIVEPVTLPNASGAEGSGGDGQ
jgi:hypothetical protein